MQSEILDLKIEWVCQPGLRYTEYLKTEQECGPNVLENSKDSMTVDLTRTGRTSDVQGSTTSPGPHLHQDTTP